MRRHPSANGKFTGAVRGEAAVQACSDVRALDRLKAELQHAFSAPDETYTALDADAVIRRNRGV